MENDNIVINQTQALKMIKSLVELSNIKSLPLSEAIEIFFKIKNVNGTRPATIIYYQNNFKLIMKYLERIAIFKTDQIDNNVILNYTNYLFTQKVSKCYINKLIGALIHLITLLAKYNYIQKYDFNYTKLKEDIKEIKTLTLEQIERIVKHITDKNILHEIAIRLFIETGVRRTELINIEISNINLLENKIYLSHTKNHDTRYIFISDRTKELIIKLLKSYERIQDNNYLFINHLTKKKITTSFVDNLFGKIKKDLDFDNLSPHLLRHTFCTFMARSKVDLKSMQKLMGHKTTAITLRYIEIINQEELGQTSINNNPLANII